ncbi:MAG: protoporphyrinogen oxidase HemJ [Proteobacteria bacterium]|nr:protoporphyrinogen oxidase HemJ [Pseudomonadota bacterium]
MYIWVKAFHLIFMVTWFAGLFYLPRLFVYHASAEDQPGIERFKTMERKLYRGIMTPGAVLTIVFGCWLVVLRGEQWIIATTWLHLKIVLVAALIGYHAYLGYLVRLFRDDLNRRSHVYYRWINELPVLVLAAIVILAVVKPTF